AIAHCRLAAVLSHENGVESIRAACAAYTFTHYTPPPFVARNSTTHAQRPSSLMRGVGRCSGSAPAEKRAIACQAKAQYRGQINDAETCRAQRADNQAQEGRDTECDYPHTPACPRVKQRAHAANKRDRGGEQGKRP